MAAKDSVLPLQGVRVQSLVEEPKTHMLDCTDKRKSHSEVLEVRTSLVIQWLQICLPMQRTLVGSLVRELLSHTPQAN